MQYKYVDLQKEFPLLEAKGSLTIYSPSNLEEFCPNRKRRTVLIIPGGVYSFVSEREGEPVALKLLSHDFICVVLKYEVGPFHKQWQPFLIGWAGIAYLRKHASLLNIDESHLSLLGFSAGGHFAATLAAYQNNNIAASFFHLDPKLFQINGLLLGYPVITMEEQTHVETMQNVTHGDRELIKRYSIEKHVTPSFPKTFLFTTFNDDCVDSSNSLLLAKALKEAGVPFEFHLYPNGPHGTSVGRATYPEGTDETFLKSIDYIASWVEAAVRFIKETI